MNSNKNKRFEKLYRKKFDNPVIYGFAKDVPTLDLQIKKLKHFCDNNKIKHSFIIFDLGGDNLFENKSTLYNYILKHSNENILINDLERISENKEEILDAQMLAKENNVNIYILNKDMMLNEIMITPINKKDEKDIC